MLLLLLLLTTLIECILIMYSDFFKLRFKINKTNSSVDDQKINLIKIFI